MIQFQNLIAGEFTPPVGGQYFSHTDALTEAAIGEIADSEFMDAVRALQAANQAHLAWQKLDRNSRMLEISSLLARFESRLPDFSNALSYEQGANSTIANRACRRAWSLAKSQLESELVEPFAQSSRSIEACDSKGFAKSNAQRRSVLAPLGVVALITPRVDAFETILARMIPALAAGDMVILKGSSLAPRTTQIIAECIRELCQTPDLEGGQKKAWSGAWVQVLQGKGEKVGNALVIHPGIHTLSFTGQTSTALQIQTAASDSFKRFHYALGSRNPVLIFQETKIQEVVPKLMDLCIRETGAKRGSRIFVQESVYKDYLAAIQEALEKIRLGSPIPIENDLGPVATSQIRDQLKAIVSVAKSERAKLLNTVLPELPDQGYFVQPEALYDLTYCSTIQQEEILGPIVTITSFKYQHDALKHAATSPYGRLGYVFCDDPEKAQRVSEKLDVECVVLNPNPEMGQNLDDQSMASSGLRQSGWGGSGFREMVRFFSRETAVFGA